jgi:biopolymer transport protein ExbD
MWGFVSVMLAILVWTRFGLPYPPHAYGSEVDRAIAAHSSLQPGALREDALLINVTRDGNVFFRDHRIELADLANEIRQGMQNGAEKRIYLLVDARAYYGNAMTVLVQVRLAGIENVTLLTERPYR